MKYRNARYIDSTRIDCEVEHSVYGWIPYTLDPTDTDMNVDNDALLAVMSENGDVAAYVPPTQEELDAEAAQEIRNVRNSLLSRMDAVVSNPLRWSDFTEEQQQAWTDYRQALLDVPQQDGFPHDVTWPEKPE